MKALKEFDGLVIHAKKNTSGPKAIVYKRAFG